MWGPGWRRRRENCDLDVLYERRINNVFFFKKKMLIGT